MTKRQAYIIMTLAGAAHLCGALWRVSGAAACGGDHRSAGRLMGRNAPREQGNIWQEIRRDLVSCQKLLGELATTGSGGRRW